MINLIIIHPAIIDKIKVNYFNKILALIKRMIRISHLVERHYLTLTNYNEVLIMEE